MNLQQVVQAIISTFNIYPRAHRLLLATLSLFTITWFLCKQINYCHRLFVHKIVCRQNETAYSPSNSDPLDEAFLEEVPTDEIDRKIELKKSNYEHLVAQNDTLEGVLTQYGVELAEVALLYRQHPTLRHLNIGQRLSWRLNEQGQLQQLTWYISSKKHHIYQRTEQRFSVKSEQIKGSWQKHKISGQINENFVVSAREAGLTTQEIQQVVQALQWQLNFRRMRSGDQFTLIVLREYLQNKITQSKLLAVRFKKDKRLYHAFRAEDGRFYDLHGTGLAKGFLNLPTIKRFPISSSFNPKRFHPVTGKRSPHNGVDFAMPTGTPIITVGDGEVIQAGYSPTAGYHVVIRHGRQYISRYFHLNKLKVRHGQPVKRGEIIALSGNSGRSTGPHLHFEFHINHRPVNPLTACLPSAESLSGSERKLFLAKANDILKNLL